MSVYMYGHVRTKVYVDTIFRVRRGNNTVKFRNRFPPIVFPRLLCCTHKICVRGAFPSKSINVWPHHVFIPSLIFSGISHNRPTTFIFEHFYFTRNFVHKIFFTSIIKHFIDQVLSWIRIQIISKLYSYISWILISLSLSLFFRSFSLSLLYGSVFLRQLRLEMILCTVGFTLRKSPAESKNTCSLVPTSDSWSTHHRDCIFHSRFLTPHPLV